MRSIKVQPIEGLEIPTIYSHGDETKTTETPSERRLRYATLLGMILGTTLGPQNDGMASTWPNVFASDVGMDKSALFNTTLSLTDWQMDFMSSSYFIGTLPIIVVSGWLVAWLGRRRCMILSAIPGLISWLCITLAPNVSVILIGRFLCGAAHGLQGIAARSYISEVADPRIRGAAGVTTESMKGIGGILIIFLGIFLPWYYVALFGACHFMIFGFIVIPCLPESPSYLIVKEKEDEAKEILRMLRGPYCDLSNAVNKLKLENKRADGTTGWRVLFKPDIIKKYLIVAGLFFISNFSGVEVVRGNATRMLQTSGLAFDKDISTMVVFIVLLTGNLSQTLILDWIGRRKCLVISLIILVLSYTVLGTYLFIKSPQNEFTYMAFEHNTTIIQEEFGAVVQDTWSWVPTACFMSVAFGSSLGIGPIPWLLSTEYFHTTIRPHVLSALSMTMNLMAIASLQLYSPLQDILTPAGLYWCYGSISTIGIVYTLVFVQETKGISIG